MAKSRSSLLAVLLILLWTSETFCQEFLTGRVVAVDLEKMDMVVVSQTDPESQMTVRIAEKNSLPRENGHVSFPGCVVPGATIRLWGQRGQLETSLFLATDIRGCREGGCSDPTGVRSRLWKSRRNGVEIPGQDADLNDSDHEFRGGRGRENGGHGNGGNGSGGGNGRGGGGGGR